MKHLLCEQKKANKQTNKHIKFLVNAPKVHKFAFLFVNLYPKAIYALGHVEAHKKQRISIIMEIIFLKNMKGSSFWMYGSACDSLKKV